MIYERLHRYILKANGAHLELMLIRLFASLSYMNKQWPQDFHIESTVMNTISLMQQQINPKKMTFEQFLTQIYGYYNEHIQPKLIQLDPSMWTHCFVRKQRLICFFRYTIKSICWSQSLHQCSCGNDFNRISAHSRTAMLPSLERQFIESSGAYHATITTTITISTVGTCSFVCSWSFSSIAGLFIDQENSQTIRPNSSTTICVTLQISSSTN